VPENVKGRFVAVLDLQADPFKVTNKEAAFPLK